MNIAKRPLHEIIGLGFLFGNIVYLGTIYCLPYIYIIILESGLHPLTKQWLTNLVGFLGQGQFKGTFPLIQPFYVLILLLVGNIVAFCGLFLKKKWGVRTLKLILVSMFVWGFAWPTISERSSRTMELFMQRAYQGYIYNEYWEPLKMDLCSTCSPSAYPVQQYEPVNLWDDSRDNNKYAGDTTKEIFTQLRVNPELAPAYWGIFKMSRETFIVSREMYQLLLFFVEILFYLWFLVFPLILFIAFHRYKDPLLAEGKSTAEVEED